MDDTATPHTAQPAGDELGTAIRGAVGRLYRRFRAERADGQLGDAAMGVLTRLEKNGPQTLKALSDYDRVTPASMSQIVNRLTAAGYATRNDDPDDGRRVLFAATPEGAELVNADRARRQAWLDSHLAELSADDRAALARAAALLQQIADS
ncbi:MarR family winged helix-turn-helix transcriptional regulator [Compostimonas suwonensis]|uniref:DNA-binding MarR family transcriptional regulator n=1 Tax=Compostimonas suwonensis TaxID=1048394 RepID=A0A2M9BWJ2_9MICO|nr:MarR family transcriptional regulator [Compostimonas suwonensis]PJJ62310.1 DNA-binding MarR family transcriptional regulator [Compostimonas suwonensis]